MATGLSKKFSKSEVSCKIDENCPSALEIASLMEEEAWKTNYVNINVRWVLGVTLF